MSKTKDRTYSEKDQDHARKAKLSEIKSLLTKVTSNELVVRYQIGAIVQDVRTNKKKYGVGAVKQLAEDLSYEVTTLYDHGNVVATWPEKEFTRICKRRTTGAGLPISFSILIELTKRGLRTNAKRRESLLEKAFDDALSVRVLKEKISGKSTAKATAPRNLGEVVAAIDTTLEKQAQWQASLPTMCKGPSTKELVDQIAAAKAKLEAQRAAADEAIKMLEIEQRRVEAEVGAEVVTSRIPAAKNGQIASAP